MTNHPNHLKSIFTMSNFINFFPKDHISWSILRAIFSKISCIFFKFDLPISVFVLPLCKNEWPTDVVLFYRHIRYRLTNLNRIQNRTIYKTYNKLLINFKTIKRQKKNKKSKRNAKLVRDSRTRGAGRHFIPKYNINLSILET